MEFLWKDILIECKKVANVLEELQDQRQVYKSIAEKCTARYSFAPAHTNDDENKVAAIHRLVMLDKMIDEKMKEHCRLQSEARWVIRTISDKRLRKIFERRYVKNWNWKLIADAMMLEGDMVSVRHLLRLHAKGMAMLEQNYVDDLKRVM